MDSIIIREKAIDYIRGFFKKKGFREVFTPILVPVPSSEPNLEVFETRLRTARGEKRRAFLITSPEYAVKKLLARGVGNCFEITKSFRNGEEVSAQHNTEFTILEWYRVGEDYFRIMEDVEEMFCGLVGDKEDQENWGYQGIKYDLKRPWPRMTVKEAFGGKIPEEENFYQEFFNKVEPRLRESRRPYFIYDYPGYQASLARKNKDGTARRFEVFLAGMELGNCFSELTDWKEQERRCKKDILERKKLKKTSYPVDEEFIKALKNWPDLPAGRQGAAGIAVGVDRLIMLLADVSSVAETLEFPAGEMFDI